MHECDPSIHAAGQQRRTSQFRSLETGDFCTDPDEWIRERAAEIVEESSDEFAETAHEAAQEAYDKAYLEAHQKAHYKACQEAVRQAAEEYREERRKVWPSTSPAQHGDLGTALFSPAI